MNELLKEVLVGVGAAVAFAVAFFPPCGAVVWRFILWLAGCE